MNLKKRKYDENRNRKVKDHGVSHVNPINKIYKEKLFT